MPRRVQRHATPAGQFFVVRQPAVWRRYRGVGHAEHLALHFQVVPQRLVVLVQVQRGAGQFLEPAGGEEVIEVRMGVDDADQGQAVGLQAGEDLLRVATWIDDDGLLAEWVADQRAVALQRADGEGFADERGLGWRGLHVC
ncbi:hypothetical protein D3C71_1656100 [compost metagenome]